jgi:hypothetical protein
MKGIILRHPKKVNFKNKIQMGTAAKKNVVIDCITKKTRGSKSFVKRIEKVLKDKGMVVELTIWRAYMKRGNSRGEYYQCIEIFVCGAVGGYSMRTTDSMLWDFYEGTEKEQRQLFEAVFEYNILKIKEDFETLLKINN